MRSRRSQRASRTASAKFPGRMNEPPSGWTSGSYPSARVSSRSGPLASSACTDTSKSAGSRRSSSRTWTSPPPTWKQFVNSTTRMRLWPIAWNVVTGGPCRPRDDPSGEGAGRATSGPLRGLACVEGQPCPCSGGRMEHATAGIRDEAARAEAQGSADGGRPLRVAMLASMFPPSIGGIQIHTLRLSQKLVERGLDVHVVTRIQPGLAPFERMCGVRVHRVGLPAARGAAGSLAFVAEGVRALLRLAEHVDVLHAHQLLSPSTIGLLASPLTGLPLVVNPHACGAIGDVAVLSGSRAGRLRLRAIVARADAFVAVSRTIRDELAGVGAPPQAIWSISNGVDTDRFCPAPPRERLMIRRALDLPDAPLVVYTGRLAPEKGVDLLLDAWA